MIKLVKNQKATLRWEVLRGGSNEREDFSGCVPILFLLSETDKIPIDYDVVDNIITAEIDQTQYEGVYGFKLLWNKGGEKFCMSVVSRVFVVSGVENPSLPTPIIKLTSHVATYGYDGLSAYEIYCIKNATEEPISENNWVANLEDMNETLEEWRTTVLETWEEAEEARSEAETARSQAEALRVSTFNANEGNSTEKADANGSRWQRYKYAEATRESNFEMSEGSDTSEDGSRWGTFNTNEAAREATFDANEADRAAAFTASEAAREAQHSNAETSRANQFLVAESGRENQYDTLLANAQETVDLINEKNEEIDSITEELYAESGTWTNTVDAVDDDGNSIKHDAVCRRINIGDEIHLTSNSPCKLTIYSMGIEEVRSGVAGATSLVWTSNVDMDVYFSTGNSTSKDSGLTYYIKRKNNVLALASNASVRANNAANNASNMASLAANNADLAQRNAVTAQSAAENAQTVYNQTNELKREVYVEMYGEDGNGGISAQAATDHATAVADSQQAATDHATALSDHETYEEVDSRLDGHDDNIEEIANVLEMDLSTSGLRIESVVTDNYPARRDGSLTKPSRPIGGYTVNLAGLYAQGYRYIYFRGSEYQNTTDAGTITRGIVVDASGNVQSLVPFTRKYSTGWNTLEIDENSSVLRATYFKADGTLWSGWTPSAVYALKTKSEENALQQLHGEISDMGEENSVLVNDLSTKIAVNRDKIDVINDILSINDVSDELTIGTCTKDANHPATVSGTRKYVGYYDGYTIDLTGYYAQGYRSIYFRGSEAKKDSVVCRGCILKADGTIDGDSMCKTYQEGTTGWQELPITENSAKLWASILINDGYLGDSAWDFEYVTLKKSSQNNNVISEIQNDIATLKATGDNSDSIKKVFEVLNITSGSTPITVTNITLVNRPARHDGSSSKSGYFKGYTVDLTGYYEQGYRKVYFRGGEFKNTGAVSDICRGLIKKADGTVESHAGFKASMSNCWDYLEITAESQTLLASYCVDAKGGEIWEPEYVQLFGEDSKNAIEELEDSISELEDKVEKLAPMTFLPKTIYGVKNETMQLFKRGVCAEQNIGNYVNRFYASGLNGKTYNRYAEITPLASTDYTLKHFLYDNDYNLKSTDESTLKVCNAPTTSPANNINVLCVGASTSASGEWESELKRRLTGITSVDRKGGAAPTGSGLSNITFVGRKEAYGTKFEATGGWTWKRYITKGEKAVRFQVTGVSTISQGDTIKYAASDGKTASLSVEEVNVTGSVGNIRCTFKSSSATEAMPSTESGTLTNTSVGNTLSYTSYASEYYSPFFNTTTNKIDFASYMQQYASGANIDVCVCWLGCTNYGIYGQQDISGMMEDMKTFIDALHTEYPNCKVLIIPDAGKSVDCGVEFNASVGSKNTSQGAVVSAFRYAKAVDEFVNSSDYSSFCYIVDTLAEVDAEYVFPQGLKAVNTRMPNVLEEYGSNGAHPEFEGYMMVADSVYRCFCNVVLND